MTQSDCMALAEMGRAYGTLRGVVDGLAAIRAIDGDLSDTVEQADAIWDKAVGSLGKTGSVTFGSRGITFDPIEEIRTVPTATRNPVTGGMVATCDAGGDGR